MDKKVVIMTGGSRGLGKSHCEVFLAHGYRVVSVDIAPAEWMDGNEDCMSTVCDVRDREGLKKIRDEVLEKWGHIDCLVNNASVQGAWKQPIDILPDDNWDFNISVNMTGTFNCTKIFGSAMMERGGAIINIASMAGLAPMPGGSVAYSSSKHGVIMITECTAVEWGQYGIRSNCVCPGPVETEINRSRYDMPGVREGRANLIPLKRNPDPKEISNVVYFLASDEASFVNGVTIPADGGLCKTTWVPFANLS